MSFAFEQGLLAAERAWTGRGSGSADRPAVVWIFDFFPRSAWQVILSHLPAQLCSLGAQDVVEQQQSPRQHHSTAAEDLLCWWELEPEPGTAATTTTTVSSTGTDIAVQPISTTATSISTAVWWVSGPTRTSAAVSATTAVSTAAATAVQSTAGRVFTSTCPRSRSIVVASRGWRGKSRTWSRPGTGTKRLATTT